MHLNASKASPLVQHWGVAPYPFRTYLDSQIVPQGHSRAFWSRSSLSGKNIQCHRQPEFTKIGFFALLRDSIFKWRFHLVLSFCFGMPKTNKDSLKPLEKNGKKIVTILLTHICLTFAMHRKTYLIKNIKKYVELTIIVAQ